ncbi:MAG: metal-dependent hydrolase [Bacteroidota bacterium]
MDSITHIAIGICTGELIAGKKLGKKAMLWGAIANSIPDVDVVTSLWMNPADALMAHRGFTHSILFQLLFIPLAAFLLRRLYRKEDFSFNNWMLLIGSGLFLHIFLDALTSYGTGWFEPFSHYRVSFNTLFILDPLFSISFIIGAIVLLIMKKKNPGREKIARIFVIISACYLLFTMINKVRVNEVVEKTLTRNNISNENYFSTPTPLNNFLWYIVASDSNGIHIGYYSIFDHSDSIQYTTILKNPQLDDSLKENEDVQKLVRFSQGFFLLKKENDVVVFSDLRMGQLGGWSDPEAPFVFRYFLTERENNSLMIQKGRMKSMEEGAMWKLWQRIKGI